MPLVTLTRYRLRCDECGAGSRERASAQLARSCAWNWSVETRPDGSTRTLCEGCRGHHQLPRGFFVVTASAPG